MTRNSSLWCNSLRVLIIILALHWTEPTKAQGFRENFIDTLDSALDLSQWMANFYGAVPIATLITEPAVGYGVAGGLIFIHRNKKELAQGIKSPPSVSAVGGLYTENGTWGTFLFHNGIWKQDHLRYLGAVGYVSANLAYYRDVPLLGEAKFDFNLEGAFLLQELAWRLGESRVFAGGRYSIFGSSSRFNTDLDLPVEPRQLDLNIGALGPVAFYDQRDNTFTPNKGIYSKATYGFYHEYFGSDQEFHRLDYFFTGFSQTGKLTWGLRADARVAYGDVAFYSQPYVILRGVPVMRYQDRRVVVFETEERWDFSFRWSLVGFVGAGKAFPDADRWHDKDWVYSYGGGFRYKLARLFKTYAGVDVGKGPEDWAVYIQFGHYWNQL